MTFENYETGVQSGSPAMLFLVEYGDQGDNYFAYTDYDTTCLFDGKTFWPTPIYAGSVESSGTLDNTTLEIEITPEAGIVSMFRNGAPTHPVRMTLYQGHPEDPDDDYKPVWTGRVISVERGGDDGWAVLACEPVAVSLRRTGLRRHYQYGCPWVLYGAECGVDKANFSVSAVAQAHGKNYVDLPAAWEGAFPREQFIGGFVQYEDPSTGVTMTHTIIDLDSETRLVLGAQRLDVLDGETTITCFLGCKHTLEDCREVFDNVPGYGGQPWIPTDNPTRGTNQFH